MKAPQLLLARTQVDLPLHISEAMLVLHIGQLQAETAFKLSGGLIVGKNPVLPVVKQEVVIEDLAGLSLELNLVPRARTDPSLNDLLSVSDWCQVIVLEVESVLQRGSLRHILDQKLSDLMHTWLKAQSPLN